MSDTLCALSKYRHDGHFYISAAPLHFIITQQAHVGDSVVDFFA